MNFRFRRGADRARRGVPVATGVLMHFTFVWGPLFEFGLRLPLQDRLVGANPLAFVGLLVCDARLKRRPRAAAQNSQGSASVSASPQAT